MKLFELPRDRKAQGLSINMIILVAIALLVLIIIAVLVSRSGRDFSKSTECIKSGGVCRIACFGDEERSPLDNEDNKLCAGKGVCCVIKD